MKISPCPVLSILLLLPGAVSAQKAPLPNLAGPLPVDDPKKPAIVLLDDQAGALIPHLTNDQDVNGRAARADTEWLDAHSGGVALKIGPQQRFRAELPGWKYPIREKPGPGEFRFLRFAWKKVGGTGITLQLHNIENNRGWMNNRYFAGNKFFGWQAIQVAEKPPAEWTVVTRDMFKDFGDITITGMAFVATDGGHGLFDHVMLGRSEQDLEALSREILGRDKPALPLAGADRDKAWEALNERDPAQSGPAIRAFLGSAADQVGFLRERLSPDSPAAVAERAERTKISALINQLGDDDFETRNRAEADLRKIGPRAVDEIQAALNSGDPEIAFRAGRLAKVLNIAVTDAPLGAIRAARITRILERADNEAAIRLLRELSGDGHGAHLSAAARATLARMGKK